MEGHVAHKVKVGGTERRCFSSPRRLTPLSQRGACTLSVGAGRGMDARFSRPIGYTHTYIDTEGSSPMP
eukprot:6181095-Pleurochrysis_carterae.AAC.2